MKLKKILVIGGGVGGPVLGLFLKRAGVDVEIMEASERPSEAGGALGIAADGMHVLTAAGVAELLRDVSVTAGEAVLREPARQTPCPGSHVRSQSIGEAGIMVTRAASSSNSGQRG